MKQQWQIWVVAGMALGFGIVGAMGYTLYHRHNVQHWNMEQTLRQQEAINREFAQAINTLLQRK